MNSRGRRRLRITKNLAGRVVLRDAPHTRMRRGRGWPEGPGSVTTNRPLVAICYRRSQQYRIETSSPTARWFLFVLKGFSNFGSRRIRSTPSRHGRTSPVSMGQPVPRWTPASRKSSIGKRLPHWHVNAMAGLVSPNYVRARWAYSELLSLRLGDEYQGPGMSELRQKAREKVPFDDLERRYHCRALRSERSWTVGAARLREPARRSRECRRKSKFWSRVIKQAGIGPEK
jgi:hypothetical protein